MSTELDLEARAILRCNDRGGYTVPTHGLYPFQWNWDSAFVALGFAEFDRDRAWQEIETLVSAQWEDGMIPHIVFHQDDDGYFPGPGVWATGKVPATSGITQPPVLASVVRQLWEQEGADPGHPRMRRLYAACLKSHRWFHKFRDPLGNVDPQRVYVFGHSMGGVLAPYLAKEVPVRGSIVYGTLVRTWFEYQLENVRRQAALQDGASEADITDAVLAEAKSSSMMLVEKKTLGDVWARWPELRQPTQGLMLDENHMSTRSMAFFHQLQDLNLARAWQEASGAVLAIYGEDDVLVDPRGAARAAREFPDAEVVLLDDCGHVAQMEHPEFVKAAWDRFIARDARVTSR